MNFPGFVKKKLLSLLPVSSYIISGNSMLPLLKPGNKVLVNKIIYRIRTPRVGEIIVLHDPRDNKILIKRITKIKNKKYFVEGDNKSASTDSRKFGMIEKAQIIGKVISY